MTDLELLLIALVAVLWFLGGYSTFCAIYPYAERHKDPEPVSLVEFACVVIVWPALAMFNLMTEGIK